LGFAPGRIGVRPNVAQVGLGGWRDSDFSHDVPWPRQ
jgi:hypothetical protein